MSNTPHELADDFPGMGETIHALKRTDAHFARLMDEYHDTNREVHRAETRVSPTDDAHETALRQRRMRLKDDIHRLLKAAAG